MLPSSIVSNRFKTSKYRHKISRYDLTLKQIELWGLEMVDDEMVDLSNSLLSFPNNIERLWLSNNKLTDATGIMIARYVAVSSSIRRLDLMNNHISAVTCLALATALHVNASLSVLNVCRNRMISESTQINAAFVKALRLNPNHPSISTWCLYSLRQNDFPRLKFTAEKSTPPSMLEFLLCIHFEFEKNN